MSGYGSETVGWDGGAETDYGLKRFSQGFCLRVLFSILFFCHYTIYYFTTDDKLGIGFGGRWHGLVHHNLAWHSVAYFYTQLGVYVNSTVLIYWASFWPQGLRPVLVSLTLEFLLQL